VTPTIPEVFVVSEGAGRPIVITHGFNDDSRSWDEVSRRLASTFRTVRWDLPGHGRSPLPPGGCGPDDAVSRLARLAGDSGTVLVGHSLGGYLTLRHLVGGGTAAAAVLISTGPGFRDPAQLEAFNRRSVRRVEVDQGRSQVARMPDSRVIDGVAALDLPVLVIRGRDDTEYAPGCGYLAARILGARSIVIDGGGHNLHRTHAQQLDEAIASFLETLEVAS
jgi:pimeloyl-ACP methyl ester carboxylesterase